MPTMLHIFMVSSNPEKCIAIEFDPGNDITNFLPYEVNRVTWGTDREYDIPALLGVLYKRGWSLSEMDKALRKARGMHHEL